MTRDQSGASRAIVSRFVTTTYSTIWRLPADGAHVPASTIERSSSSGTGSGARRRIARVVARIDMTGASGPIGALSGVAGGVELSGSAGFGRSRMPTADRPPSMTRLPGRRLVVLLGPESVAPVSRPAEVPVRPTSRRARSDADRLPNE